MIDPPPPLPSPIKGGGNWIEILNMFGWGFLLHSFTLSGSWDQGLYRRKALRVRRPPEAEHILPHCIAPSSGVK